MSNAETNNKRAEQLKRITHSRINPRLWTAQCPKAYARYLDAHENLLRSLSPLPDLYFEQIIESAGVALAMAWSAGVDRVIEEHRNGMDIEP